MSSDVFRVQLQDDLIQALQDIARQLAIKNRIEYLRLKNDKPMISIPKFEELSK